MPLLGVSCVAHSWPQGCRFGRLRGRPKTRWECERAVSHEEEGLGAS
mgnify:CR=1 FL=1